MFGGARWILVEPAGDDSRGRRWRLCSRRRRRAIRSPWSPGPQARLQIAQARARRAGGPGLCELCAGRPRGRASSCSAWRAREGLIVRPDVARRIAESCGGNRAIIEQELAKFALYADAVARGAAPIDHDVVDALGAAADEGDLSRLVDSAARRRCGGAGGRAGPAPRRGAGGDHPDPRDASADGAARPAARRGRARIGARRRHGVSGKSIFFKEKDGIERQLRRWPAT